LTLTTEYQLEEFSSALKSCLTEDIGYIHIDGHRYYQIKPRHPFAIVHEFLQHIPEASLVGKSGATVSDFIISASLLLAVVVGLMAGMWRLKVFEWCYMKTTQVRKKRVSMQAPEEGGYSEGEECEECEERIDQLD
jgi:hypothetical protein